MNTRKALRGIINGEGYTMAPGAVDPLSARLVAAAGYEAVYLTGGGFSRANGYPDLGLMTMTEIVGWIGRCVEAVEIPVIADMDTGYGNALNVVRSVREYEKTGVAGFHLEDQVTPKKCGHYEGKEVVSREEMVGKIRAAVDTRQDQDMVVIARTDAVAVEGFEPALERMNAYLEAGADVGFVEAPQTVAQMADIPGRLDGPALINIFEGGKTPPETATALAAMGYRMGIYPSQTHRAAIRAMMDVLAALKGEGDLSGWEGRLASFEDREATVDTPRWRELEARYLSME